MLCRATLAGIYARLETARVKFSSLAFDVELLEPNSPVTELEARSSTKVQPEWDHPITARCYDNGQAMTLTWENRETGLLRIQAVNAHSNRRWRYICAPSTEDHRYFWYSVPRINPVARQSRSARSVRSDFVLHPRNFRPSQNRPPTRQPDRTR